jgi:hypothetical protein
MLPDDAKRVMVVPWNMTYQTSDGEVTLLCLAVERRVPVEGFDHTWDITTIYDDSPSGQEFIEAGGEPLPRAAVKSLDFLQMPYELETERYTLLLDDKVL